MVYVTMDGPLPLHDRSPRGWWSGRHLAYCRVRTATAADVRLLSQFCGGLDSVSIRGEDWWAGGLLETCARRLVAMGRVRLVAPRELLSCHSQLEWCDDIVIR